MKNKILLLALVFTFSSCSIFQKTQTVSQNVETSTSKPEDSLQKFVGNYEIEVFGLPDGIQCLYNEAFHQAKKTLDGIKLSVFWCCNKKEKT